MKIRIRAICLARSLENWPSRSHILYEGESLLKIELTESLSDGGQKKVFHTGPVECSYFRLWLTGPHNFSVYLGRIPLHFQQTSDFPCSPKSYSF